MRIRNPFISKQKEFMELYEPIHERFARYCDVKTKNTEDSKDLVSETVIVAYEGFNKIRDKKAFLHFLFGTAHRIFLNQIRRNKFKGEYTDELGLSMEDSYPLPDEKTDISLFYQTLNLLGEETKELIILKEISGFLIKEIAVMKELTESNVKIKLHRGRLKLKELLTEPQTLSK